MPTVLPPLVDPVEVHALIAQGATVLDARSRLRFHGEGHIPSAQLVSWRIGTSGKLTDGALGDPASVGAAFAALGVSPGRPVVVVGDWDRGWGEEGRIFWDLEYLGHADVHVLRGGMRAWTGPRAYLGTTGPTRGDFIANPDASKRMSAAGLAEALSAGAVLVDVREPGEFAGATPFGESRGGHVPGAINMPWRTLLSGAPSVDTSVILTCTGGVRSGMAYLMFRQSNNVIVANYDGGMWDWTRAGMAVQ